MDWLVFLAGGRLGTRETGGTGSDAIEGSGSLLFTFIDWLSVRVRFIRDEAPGGVGSALEL